MRKILCFFLAVILLTGSVSAAAGSREDPFLTESYLKERYLPELLSAYEAAISKAAAERAESRRALVTRSLGAGEYLELREGAQLTLLRGAARLAVRGGSLIDVSTGTVVTGGTLAEHHRYVLSGGTAWIDAEDVAEALVSHSAAQGETCPFDDVDRGIWYYSDVVQAYRMDLISGLGKRRYGPAETLTIAQCVKLAACMHQLAATGSVTLENSPKGVHWYRSYVDYALRNGLLREEQADYDAAITRGQFVELFYRALPESAYTRINNIPDNTIPDVRLGDKYAEEVYAFYRAGILAGYGATDFYPAHYFGQETTIKRAEVAAIMNRMFEPTARQRFSM